LTYVYSNTVTQYLLKNVTNAQTVRNRTRNQTEYNYVYVCAKKKMYIINVNYTQCIRRIHCV